MSGACFHCGATVAAGTARETVIDGERVTLCGPDCLAIAERIRDEGLTGFYRFRDGPAGAPPGRAATAGRWAGYDRAALQAEFVTTRPDGSREAQLLVQGVRCAACAWLIERAMSGAGGVREVSVDPMTTRTLLRWDPEVTSLGTLMAGIASLGYDPCPGTEDEGERAAREERRRALPRLIVAGLGMSEVMSYAIALYAGALETMGPSMQQFFRLVSLLVATPVVFYSGAPFFAGAWRGVANGRPGMDLPVALAVAAAYFASVWNTLRGDGAVYFDSAVMFVFFLSCARFLEMSGRHRALGLTGALARHLPRIATRLLDGRTETVGVAELGPGDLVLVQPGQAFPVDGRLVGGTARVDESLLTGESRPVRKSDGDPVVAGSVNLLAAATVRVRETGAGTVIGQIGRMIGVARAGRPRLVEVTDRVAVWFVSAVLALAAVVGAAWWFVEPARAFEVVLAVLVVTCPCALALATPAAFTVGMSALARRGVLLRSAGAIEALSRTTDFVFDKTGTLTEHSAGVQHVEAVGARGAQAALELAAALESRSEHPLARAFPRPRSSLTVEDVRAVPGAGLEGRVGGEPMRIGTRAFAAGLAPGGPVAPDDDAETPRVWLGDAAGLVARFDIAEHLRPGAAPALAALAADGIRVAIASGDRAGPVRAVAGRLGVADWHAGLGPADKLALVRRLQSAPRVVGVVGDGINDSPVLAGADLSVAVGNGASLAQHSADCVLVGGDLDVLPEALRIARRTMRIVRQNLWWAAGYNAVSVPLAAAGLLPPWLAALGMSASSLLVTFNALRLGAVPRRATARPGHALLSAGEVAP